MRILLDQGLPRSTAAILPILAVENASSPSVIRIRREGMKGEALSALIERVWPDIQEQVKNGAMVTITDISIRIRNIPILDRN